jgi:Skp family chaperone for outer membrane proteins
MRLLEKMCFVVLASGLALGQATAPNSGAANSGSVADDLKALREAISQQQQQIAQQQQQLQQLQQKLDEKNASKQQDASVSSSTGTSSSNSTRMAAGTPHIANASLNTTPTATMVQETEKKESPLSFRIGGTEFTPGGFIDFENVFRTTNTGASITSPFGTIPFSNAPTGAGQLSEFRSTGQYSRFNLKIAGKYGENKITGYIEGDFNGNDATNVFVTSNPHTTRVRLAWADFRRGNWEILAGQTWGLQTPNRVGLSPMPSDVFAPIGEDAQTHVGLPYTRAAELRVNYHFSDHFQWAVAVQNPDQFAINATFPAAFNAGLVAQVDQGAITSAPDAFPDLHTKMAWDTDMSGKHMHFELGGIVTSVKTANQIFTQGATPALSGPFIKHTSIGGGGEAAFNVELFKGFRIVANGIYGDGIGRYLIGLAPDSVARPIQTGPTTFTMDNSMVHSGSAIVGVEATKHKSAFGFYYGGIYAARNAFPDITAANGASVSCAPGEAATLKPCIGFGGTNSSGTANRAIQEGSFDWTQTLWRNPQYGALQLVTQTSYLTRAPWFVNNTTNLKNAHLVMGYVSLKYVIP